MTYLNIAPKRSVSLISAEFFNDTVASMREVAGEDGVVRFFGGTFWFFGSQYAVNLLADHYAAVDFVTHGHSPLNGGWFMCLPSPSHVGVMSTEGARSNSYSLA